MSTATVSRIAELPREQFPCSSILVANVTRTSLTCHEEIERVSVRRRCYGDSDLSETSRACWARGIWRTTRHTDERAAIHTAADLWPTKQISAWQAERGSRPVRPTRATFWLHPRGDVARVGRVSARMLYEDATRKLLPWNLGLSQRLSGKK